MLLIKACPRCSGAMARAETHDGPTASCVQCGCVRYLEAAVVARSSVVPAFPGAGKRGFDEFDAEELAVAKARSVRRLPRRSAHRAQTSSTARHAA